jgi:hypothetical protein
MVVSPSTETPAMSIPQIDHNAYPLNLIKKSHIELRAIIKDCQEAIKANPDNPKCGVYADEINYCVSELHYRRFPERRPRHLKK